MKPGIFIPPFDREIHEEDLPLIERILDSPETAQYEYNQRKHYAYCRLKGRENASTFFYTDDVAMPYIIQQSSKARFEPFGWDLNLLGYYLVRFFIRKNAGVVVFLVANLLLFLGLLTIP